MSVPGPSTLGDCAGVVVRDAVRDEDIIFLAKGLRAWEDMVEEVGASNFSPAGRTDRRHGFFKLFGGNGEDVCSQSGACVWLIRLSLRSVEALSGEGCGSCPKRSTRTFSTSWGDNFLVMVMGEELFAGDDDAEASD